MPGVTQGILPWSPGMEPGWADDTSNADPATVALGNGAGPFLCVAGDLDYIAAPAPLQQMPCEKLASHTYSKDHRSPWPIQTAYIPHVYIYVCKTVNRVCTHREIFQTKILKLDLWFFTFWSWWCCMFVILLLEECRRISTVEYCPSSSGSWNWSCSHQCQAACAQRRRLRKCCIPLCRGLAALVACVPLFGNLCYRSGRDSLWIRILHSQGIVKG